MTLFGWVILIFIYGTLAVLVGRVFYNSEPERFRGDPVTEMISVLIGFFWPVTLLCWAIYTIGALVCTIGWLWIKGVIKLADGMCV